MNKVFFLFLTVMFLSIGCSKEETTESSDNVIMSYKVNGNLVEVKSSNGAANAAVDGTGKVTLLGVQTGGNGITIGISSNKIGKYDLTDSFSPSYAVYSTLSEFYETEKKGDGTVEITSSSGTNLKGKFSFKGDNGSGKTVNITEGIFDVPVTK